MLENPQKALPNMPFATQLSLSLIVPKSIMNELGITVKELFKSPMVLQGFSLKSQRTIDTIRLEIIVRDL